MSTQKPLDSQKLAERLRKKSIDRQAKTIRMTKFPGSDQATDLSLPPNCGGFGRIHHFRLEPDPNWVTNPLPTLPACKHLGLPVTDVLLAQVFQLSACDFRCWYCFVDFSLLAADPKHSDMVTSKQLLQMMLDEKVNSQVIDLSGGQPELVPEYVLWFLEARKELGLEQSHFVWADDNLSTDYTWRYLSEAEITFMAQAPGFARVGCLKGFDAESFTFNTRADGALFDQQIELLGRLVAAGFDQYGYDGFLRWSIEHSPQIQWNSPLIIDGLRHGAIYTRLVEMFPRGVLVYCICDPETQLTRLMVRDQLDENDARETLSHETEKYVSELEVSANLFFRPGDSVENFLVQLDALIKQRQ